VRWLSTLRLRLRSLFRRAQVEQELEDELRFHVDQLTARHVERGLSVDDASGGSKTASGMPDTRCGHCARSPRSPRWLSSPWPSGLPPRQGCSAS
jgi:hypothetical protein